MIKLFKYPVILALLGLLSCAKEYSNESGGGLGRNCRVQSIIARDTVVNVTEYALNTRYSPAGIPNYVEAYDSIAGVSNFDFSLSYSGDTVRTDINEMVILDASRRMSRLITPLDPADPGGEKVIFTYRYDGNGYLVEKNLTTSTITVPIVTTKYAWTGGNLVKIEAVLNTLGGSEPLIQVNMEYDLTKAPRNFINIYPDSFENFFYVTSLNIGKPSTNLLRKISIIYYDTNGNPSPPEVVTIRDAKFSNDGYLTEWVADGGSFDALGLFSGKNIFSYRCN